MEFILHDDRDLARLVLRDTYWYLASPYAKYPTGHELAFRDIAEVTAHLMERGVYVFSPIVHTHPVSKYVKRASNVDHDFWLNLDRPFMRAAYGCLVAKLPGWDKSRGIAAEIEYFNKAAKQVVYLNV